MLRPYSSLGDYCLPTPRFLCSCNWCC